MNLRDIICVLVLVFQFLFLLRLVLSFFPIDHKSLWGSARSIAFSVTEPVVLPVRRVVPPLPGMFRGFGIAELLILFGLQIVAEIIC